MFQPNLTPGYCFIVGGVAKQHVSYLFRCWLFCWDDSIIDVVVERNWTRLWWRNYYYRPKRNLQCFTLANSLRQFKWNDQRKNILFSTAVFLPTSLFISEHASPPPTCSALGSGPKPSPAICQMAQCLRDAIYFVMRTGSLTLVLNCLELLIERFLENYEPAVRQEFPICGCNRRSVPELHYLSLFLSALLTESSGCSSDNNITSVDLSSRMLAPICSSWMLFHVREMCFLGQTPGGSSTTQQFCLGCPSWSVLLAMTHVGVRRTSIQQIQQTCPLLKQQMCVLQQLVTPITWRHLDRITTAQFGEKNHSFLCNSLIQKYIRWVVWLLGSVQQN